MAKQIDFTKYLTPTAPQVPVPPTGGSKGRIDFEKYLQPTQDKQVQGAIWSGGPLSDIFDALSLGQYAAAGLVTGKGIQRGIKERTSFGELLPEDFRGTTLGRVSEFVLNVAGDPLTWIPIGGVIAQGVKRIPGAAGAIAKTKGAVRVGAQRIGLAVPEATSVVAGASQGKRFAVIPSLPVQEARGALQTARSSELLARAQGTKFIREFKADARRLAGGNVEKEGELNARVAAFFDEPGDVIARELRDVDEYIGLLKRSKPGRNTLIFDPQNPTGRFVKSPQRVAQNSAEQARLNELTDKFGGVDDPLKSDVVRSNVRRAAHDARRSSLEGLTNEEKTFVGHWAERAMKEHSKDLDRLVELGYLTPERAKVWRNFYLKQVRPDLVLGPEAYADILTQYNPIEAEVIYSRYAGKNYRTTKSQGISTAAQVKSRTVLSAEERAHRGFLTDFAERFAVQKSLNQELIARADMLNTIARQYALTEDQMRAFLSMPGTRTISRKFQKFSGPKWGALDGQWVPNEIARMLKQDFWRPEGAVKTFTKYVAWWKKLKTIYNPGTQIRNILGNLSLTQAKFGTRTFKEILQELPEASKDVIDISEMYQRAIKAHPNFGSSQLDNEMRNFLKRASTPEGLSINNAPAWIPQWLVKAAQKVDSFASDVYSYSELINKMAIFRQGLKHGLTDEAAAQRAVLALFDYGDVPLAIAALRTYGLYPFVTFPYKVITHALPAIAEHPGRLAQQVKAIRAITQPQSEEERRAMPPYMRNGGFIKVMEDAKGRPVYLDVGSILFLGSLPGISTATESFVPAPFQIAMELIQNESSLTGGPIVRPEDNKSLAQLRYIVQQVAPRLVYELGETALTPALRSVDIQPRSQLARAVHNIPTSRGVEPKSAGQAIASLLGANLVPLDTKRELQARRQALLARQRELMARLSAIGRDKSLGPEEKERRRQRIREQLRELMRQFRESGTTP